MDSFLYGRKEGREEGGKGMREGGKKGGKREKGRKEGRERGKQSKAKRGQCVLGKQRHYPFYKVVLPIFSQSSLNSNMIPGLAWKTQRM
jgi:hypothetical protein